MFALSRSWSWQRFTSALSFDLMSMTVDSLVDKFPGQVETIYFSLEQVETLASPIRSEVFWSFSSTEPSSVAEIAEALGKSAQTVHYHVGELVSLGLLIAVSERKKHARQEKLYVRSAKNFYSQGMDASPEYRKHVVNGFAAMTRNMVRETQAVTEAMQVDQELKNYSSFRRALVRLSPEKAAEFRRRLIELNEEFKEHDTPEGLQVHLVTYMRPSLSESRKRLKK